MIWEAREKIDHWTHGAFASVGRLIAGQIEHSSLGMHEERPPRLTYLPKRLTEARTVWGGTGKQARMLSKFRRLFARIDGGDRQLLLDVTRKMAKR